MSYLPGSGHSTGQSILVITWVFTGISTVVVSLKFWTRLKIIQHTGLDDVLTIIALGFLLAFAPIITISVRDGLGKHVYDLTPEARTRAIKLAIISNPLIFLAAAWPNVSVAISLNRILVPPRWQVGILYGIPIFQCIIALICSIVTYNQCKPIAGIWNPTIPHRCLPQDGVVGILYFNGALSAFTHIFLAVIPIFALWNIQMETRTKAGVCLLMSTTAIAAIAAVMRTVNIDDPGLGTDFPYTIRKLLNWAIIEAAFIIIAACIPSLRPFVRALGRSLHIDHAKSFLIPKGYHHSHSRRNRPKPLVPRESGSGATAVPSSMHKHERDESMSAGLEKKQGSACNTPPLTGLTEKSMQKEAEEAASQV
ncbi:MAG: hypothetical protein LQ344_001420 [Seirophora lacunosa]|nr:MAG: hypothetical protein LQ344_001420 [Seirophora lacunosa]